MYLFNGKLHRWQQKAQDWLHDIATEGCSQCRLREELANSVFTPWLFFLTGEPHNYQAHSPHFQHHHLM